MPSEHFTQELTSPEQSTQLDLVQERHDPIIAPKPLRHSAQTVGVVGHLWQAESEQAMHAPVTVAMKKNPGSQVVHTA